MSPARLWISASAILAVLALIFIAIGYRNATADPLVRRLTLTVAGYPADAAPTRIVLFSDVHVHGPDMPPQRLEKIVEQINALHPDIDIGAGDFIGNNIVGRDYPVAEAVAPLRRLKARYGVFAVLGNNDYEAGATEVIRALHAAGVKVLRYDAARAGPIAIGGLEGVYRFPAAVRDGRTRTFEALDRLSGVKVLVAHRPDEFADAPQRISLILAGHTHCGQIVLPVLGPVETGSDFGRRFLCGVVRSGSKVLVVTAGLGTSHVPLRIGAPSDIWLITIEGPATSASQRRASSASANHVSSGIE